MYLAFMLGLVLDLSPTHRAPAADPATIPLDRPQVVTLLLGGLALTVDPAWVAGPLRYARPGRDGGRSGDDLG